MFYRVVPCNAGRSQLLHVGLRYYRQVSGIVSGITGRSLVIQVGLKYYR